jgi:hypothetical protein
MEEQSDFYKRHFGIAKDQIAGFLGTALGFMFIILLIWSLFFRPMISRFWGQPIIGAYFEKNRPYDTRYYVNLFPENADSKNYRLVGDITVYDGNCYDTGDSTECDPGTVSLNSVNWPNGGSSYFDDCALEKDKVLCTDNEDRGWYVEFTNIRVK